MIKNYKLKDGLSAEDLKLVGFTNHRKNVLYYAKEFDDISVNITIDKANICDANTKIEVLDESFCQPYLPFYNYAEFNTFRFLNQFIDFYNNTMNELVSKNIFIEILN